MRYILITFDALFAFASDRFYQSVEFEKGKILCAVLRGDISKWKDSRIALILTENGIIFTTEKCDRDAGLLFDTTTFTAFAEETDEKRINMIFQKVIRFAVKYFEGLPYSQNERILPGNKNALVFPYPYVRSRDVYKVVIDLNTSKETNRKKLNYLTAYSYETKEGVKFSPSSLEKSLRDVSDIRLDAVFKAKPDVERIEYIVTDLSSIELSLNSQIGFNLWLNFLTSQQKEFIMRPLKGPERLSGAAGTGKTLALVLRAIFLLESTNNNDEEIHIIFFTHSSSTKEMVEDIFIKNCTNHGTYLVKNDVVPKQSLYITTLQEWCADHLGINDIADNEYLDKDAESSKGMQLLYIEEAWDSIEKTYWQPLSPSFSPEFKQFVETTPKTVLLELLRREFSEIIKGQAKAKLDLYLQLDRPLYGIGLFNDYEKRFIFQVFSKYQKSLENVGLFDNDDIVLGALGQVDTLIWNRRLAKEGYDVCFIDETHLFNLNEISVFHFVNKPEFRNRIIFSIDRAQGLGDSYHADTTICIDSDGNLLEESNSKFETIFRSSIDNVALAYSILTSGASMFINLENPLDNTINVFTSKEENNCRIPLYTLHKGIITMFEDAFNWAKEYQNDSGCLRSKILFVSCSDEILSEFVKYASDHNKQYVKLENRSDFTNIRKAINDNRYVIGGIDNIGGLEFDAVIILGCDAGHVPPADNANRLHIINYSWFNRLYIAVTRAKYAIRILGEESYGISKLLQSSIDNGTLLVK